MLGARMTGDAGTAFARLRDQIHLGATKGIAAATEDAASDVRAGAPVETGALARSVRAEHDGLHGRVTVGEGTGGEAGFNEYGTHKMPAHPFVRPAIDRATSRAPVTVQGEINRRVVS